MAVKKKADYKRVGQVGHFAIALEQKRNNSGVVIESNVVLMKGKTVSNRDIKSVKEAQDLANKLMKEHKKLRKK